MTLHNPITVMPFVLLAEATSSSESWTLTMLNYGVAGGMLLWFMWRDKQEREERKSERLEQERRHQENLAAQRAVENAFRTNTNSIILAMAATKHMDAAITDLMDRVKSENGNGGR